MRVHFTNLGCKLNQAESEALARRFVAAGHVVAERLEEADLHVVNSCTVTHVAARDSRKVARRGRRLKTGLRTVLTGCYVESDPQQAAALAGVDLVVPNREKDRLVERIHERFPQIRPATPAAELEAPACQPIAFGNSRALVKIEDGCNMRCSFCIIPSTRGRQTSRPPDEVIREVTQLETAGHQEIVVTGVQISSYRHGETGLFELVGRILAETEVPRLRLTSIAPWEFDPRLLDLFSSGRVCRHVHLSLQSGCAATLRRMRRPYTPADFGALVATLRGRVPDVAITTDVIVGFPGEDEGEFEESLTFVAAQRFSRVHAFPFSPRPGTAAAGLPQPVHPKVIRERMKRMLEVAAASALDFRRAALGKRAEILWERRRKGRWQGTTDNYLRAYCVSASELSGTVTLSRIATLDEGGVTVELASATQVAAAT